MLSYENLNILWASVIIEELIRNGINYFCISPGSRSTPLVVAIARNNKANSIICYDERGSAFHALGYARATDKPAVVITTSGTAVANCFPAVVEASMDNIPLIIISADRPPELQDTMANQTIDQDHIFGRYVRYFFNLPCPTEDIPIRMVLTTIDQAIYRSLSHPSGPVHINCMFREPLSPEEKEFSSNYIEPLSQWFLSKSPYTKYTIPDIYLRDQDIKEISDIINNAQNGLLVIGALKIKEIEDVLKLIKKIPWPVFSDIRSNIFPYSSYNVLPHFALLASSYIPEDIVPDVILHIGKPIVSKHLIQFIGKSKVKEYVVIKSHPFRQDPIHKSTIQLETDIKKFCHQIIPFLKPKKSKLLNRLIRLSNKIEILIKDLFQSHDINEASLAYWISKNLPKNSALFLSNSMPIRDMDMFAQFKEDVIVGANRGASGIDGIIASATGFALGLDRLLTLLIGDIAFIHDLNSLFILKSLNIPVIIVLINNNGSGIFSFLPISKFKDIFEKYFVVPHSILSFKEIALFFGLPYFMPQNKKEFLQVYKDCVNRNESAVIEICVNRNINYKLHEHIVTELESMIVKML